MTYSDSPDYRPDIDELTPFQVSILETVERIELTVPAFHPYQPCASVPSTPMLASARKQVTYIGLSKKVMPSLVDMCLCFGDRTEIYENGKPEAVLSYSIPIQLMDDCPSASKYGKDPSLWKTATTCFLHIVTECTGDVSCLGISDARVEIIWRRIIVEEIWQTGKPTLAELFHVLGGLEDDDSAVESARASQDSYALQISDIRSLGSTAVGSAVPEVLVLVLGLVIPDLFQCNKRRIAKLCLPPLLDRCQTAMMSYFEDEALRRNLAFPSVREDELLHILRKLLKLRLWPGIFWAAFSDAPTRYTAGQPPKSSALCVDPGHCRHRPHLLSTVEYWTTRRIGLILLLLLPR
ncbi:hypothetical protein EDC04DRAFT_2602691 [Pisolithus marmoratus]|nr:hypothetical protein EDC04DRAFT_2602691 [Pisolithus marmoratus]